MLVYSVYIVKLLISPINVGSDKGTSEGDGNVPGKIVNNISADVIFCFCGQ